MSQKEATFVGELKGMVGTRCVLYLDGNREITGKILSADGDVVTVEDGSQNTARIRAASIQAAIDPRYVGARGPYSPPSE